ncbi:MAG TPA: aminotransferase class V-fold PLP-dependent enzyme [Alphaproteobacteria bacterium]|nr:aminotransferase class V-fold PLP-dependent enzyme [Alphaproteobacteria bacterium]
MDHDNEGGGAGGAWSPRSRTAQALGWTDGTTRAVSLPLHLSSTFIRDPDNQYRAGFAYARDDNPTYAQAEALLASLEGGREARLFASGMAAAAAVFQALRPGDHVVAPTVMYWGLRKWLQEVAMPWGLAVDFIATEDSDALRTAIQPGHTRLVWLETPANPLWSVSDIAAAAELAHEAGALLAVDNTVATPVLTRPLALGADIVMHSATKYLNGHSDVIAGALVGAHDDETWQRIRTQRHDGGAILGGFEAWLLTRGMRTLFLRVEQACRTAQRLAQHFEHHPKVAAVLYPGLPGHPGHALAARQMQGGFGGMLSLRLRGGEAAAIAVAARLGLWKRATSLGGVESLVEHRASVEGPDTPVPADLLRLSCGIEDADDLAADLEQALATV